jgi:hypothetical protein
VIAEEMQSNAELTGALAGLPAVSEAHPDLQSARHYAELMTDLRDAADRIAATRGLYNGNVARYNEAEVLPRLAARPTGKYGARRTIRAHRPRTRGGAHGAFRPELIPTVGARRSYL